MNDNNDARQPLPYQFEPTRDVDSDDDESDSSWETDDSSQVDSETEQWRLESDLWCTCRNCDRLPTIAECLCCQEMTELESKLEELRCITQHPDFSVICLHPEVLRTGLVARWAIRREVLEDPIPHRCVLISYHV